MNTDAGPMKFLDETLGTLNKHETVIWGQDPVTEEIEIQFLRGPAREYLKQAQHANDEARLTPLRWWLTRWFGIAGAISLAGLIWHNLGGIDFDIWSIVLILVLLLSFFFLVENIPRNRSSKRLGQTLGDLLEKYTATIRATVDDDDLYERNIAIQSALDRITLDVRDSIVTLLDANEEEAVQHVVTTLIEEEQDIIDRQRNARRGTSETRIADITEDILKKTRRR